VKEGGGRSGIFATETNNTKAAIPDSNAGWWPSTSETGLGRPDRRRWTSLYPVCTLSGFETGPPMGIQAISKIQSRRSHPPGGSAWRSRKDRSQPGVGPAMDRLWFGPSGI